MNKKLAHVPGGKKIIQKEGERKKTEKMKDNSRLNAFLDLQLSFLYLAREHVKVFMKMALSAIILVVNLYMGFLNLSIHFWGAHSFELFCVYTRLFFIRSFFIRTLKLKLTQI